MKWFVNLPARAKFLIGFGMVIAFLIAVMWTARNGINKIERLQKDIFYEEFANSVDLLRLKADENEIRLALLTMMNAADKAGKEQWHRVIKDTAGNIEKLMQGLIERNISKPAVLHRLEELNTVRLAFKQTRDSQIIPLIYEGNLEEARKLALGIQSERFEKMASITGELVKYADEEAKQHIEESEQTARQSINLFMNAGVIAIFIGLIVAVFMNRIIAKPLKNISSVAERIAAGDLTVNQPFDDREDEIGILSQTFRIMVEKLQKQLSDIIQAVNILASSSSQIATGVTQLSTGTEQTAVAVTETTTTAEEVKQAATVSVQKAKQVSEISQNSVRVSQTGEKLVNETINGINKIKEQMEYVAETIVRLSEHNQTISEIITVVDDLAEQSNILAVNASIEATKVGEQGKGFLVVANEIRSLAEQSRQATKQVRTILSDIQKATSTAVMEVERGSKSVEAVVKQSAGTGDSIREMVKSISESSHAVMQISASSQQQLVGMDQVVMAMSQIKQATTQNAAGTKQIEITVRELQGIGQKLKDMVKHYTI